MKMRGVRRAILTNSAKATASRAVISSWLPTDGRDHVLYVNDDDDLQQLLFSSNGTFTERTVMTDVGPWGFQVCSKNAGERGVVFWDMNDIKWATLTNSSSPSLDYTQTVSTERLSVLACGDFDGNGQGEILATKKIFERRRLPTLLAGAGSGGNCFFSTPTL